LIIIKSPLQYSGFRAPLAFETNNFKVELQKEDIEFDNEINNTNTKSKKTLNNLRITRKTKKLNLTKMENIKVKKEFNWDFKGG
jgi:lipopolysaccharide export system protein LptC